MSMELFKRIYKFELLMVRINIFVIEVDSNKLFKQTYHILYGVPFK